MKNTSHREHPGRSAGFGASCLLFAAAALLQAAKWTVLRARAARLSAMLAAATMLAAAAGPAWAVDVTFVTTSDTITHPWFALRPVGATQPIVNIGTAYRLDGTGRNAGLMRTVSLSGKTTVLGVKCLVYHVCVATTEIIIESYYYCLAQDTDGNVRFLKVQGIDTSGAAVAWQAATVNDAPIFLPSTPAVGQHFGWYGGQSLDVLAVDQTVPRGANGTGPFYNCIQLRWTSGSLSRDMWVSRNLGVIKEDWTDSSGEAGWHRAFRFPELFPSASLRKAILDQTGKTSDTITLADLQTVTSLTNVQFSSALGLQHCDQLRELTAYVNSSWSGSELTFIAALPSLRELTLDGAELSDLTPLATATSLRRLGLLRGTVTSIAPLAGMHDLEELALDEQRISNLSPLAGLTRLTTLSLNNNSVQDLTPLADLTNLTSLSMEGNGVDDLSPLAELTKLTTLIMGANSIQDLAPLSNLTHLIELSLVGNRVQSLAALAGLENLTTLNLDINQVADLTPLAGCHALECLYLARNTITDLAPLGGLANLKRLRLSENPVSVIADLSGMVALEMADLDFCQMVDITGLAGLPKLLSLRLDRNDIADVQPLAGLPSLVFVDLSHNEIEDVSPLATLQSLTSLYLTDNRITDFSALTTMAALKTLNLDENAITEIPPIDGMAMLTNLQLGDNLITNVSGLACQTHVSWLGLDNNLISDIRPLASLPDTMSSLVLSGNLITYLEPLAGKKFMWLFLDHNRIRDLGPLLSLQPADPWNSDLSLYDNPLAEAAKAEQIPALEKLFRSVGFSAKTTIQLTADVDVDWIYQNTPATTLGRHRMVVTMHVDHDPYGNTTYIPFVAARDPEAAAVEPPEGDTFTWIVRGGPQGSGPGANELTISVAGVEKGGVGAVAIAITIRPLGDINGDGVVTAEDKLEMNKFLNGLATLPGIGLRELDLTGDGETVNVDDKIILNRILNGLAVP